MHVQVGLAQNKHGCQQMPHVIMRLVGTSKNKTWKSSLGMNNNIGFVGFVQSFS